MNNLSAWERIEIVRHPKRPSAIDYIPLIFEDFYELHGDRLCGDDGAVMGGVGRFRGIPVTVAAQVKGRDLQENKQCNFGMPHPEGYRKALRLAKQAEKFRRPVIFFVDTPGAYPGVDAEKHGQGEAIAANIAKLMTLKTPIISIVLGEGGSGGALAMAVCDELLMLENAVYSVISPSGFASILWKDPAREKEACEIMKITAEDMMRLKVCDGIIPEPMGGAHNDCQQTAENISDSIFKSLERKLQKGLDELLIERYNRFRLIGEFQER